MHLRWKWCSAVHWSFMTVELKPWFPAYDFEQSLQGEWREWPAGKVASSDISIGMKPKKEREADNCFYCCRFPSHTSREKVSWVQSRHCLELSHGLGEPHILRLSIVI